MFETYGSETDFEKNIFFEKIISENIKSENLGKFAGIFEHPYIPEYYLVGCSECVGTKIIPMAKRKMWKEIAHELVAMCLNDISCTGARPMFFLDYLAVNTINLDNASIFISTLKEVLEKHNCTLLSGKTTEFGSLIEENHFDVGGFMVGILKKEKLLNKSSVLKDDVIIGFKSSGVHTSGFSIIRNLYSKKLISDEFFEKLLTPSFIYSDVIEKLCSKNLIKAAAHISNGGIGKNLFRIIPNGYCTEINFDEVPKQEIFETLKDLVGFEKAYKEFNMGVGYCVITSEENCSEIFDIAKEFEPFTLGTIKNALTKEEKNKKISFL